MNILTGIVGRGLVGSALSLILFMGVHAQTLGPDELDCVIEPHMVVDLSSRVDGIVESIAVERGDLVDDGQDLVKLDSGVETAVVQHSRARARAMAEVSAGAVSLEFANRRKERVETLFRTAAVSPDQMDEISTEAHLAQLQLQRARENKELAELELNQSIEILNRHMIKSPIRGVVVQKFLSPGESVKDVPIMRIAQIDPLRVEVIVPVSEFGTIKAGQPAIVRPEAPMQGNYAAVVSVVDRVADAASGTFRVRLSLPNPDYALPSGLKCGVKFLPLDAATKKQIAAAEKPGNNEQTVSPVPRMTAETKPLQCQTVGPIEQQDEALSLITELKAYAGEIQVRESSTETLDGYLVMTPDLGSVAQAMELAATIKTAGIDDLYVMPSRDKLAGRVSLGFFHKQGEAESRLADLAVAGIDAEILPRFKVAKAFWVDLETVNPAQVAAIPALDALSVESVVCDSALAASD